MEALPEFLELADLIQIHIDQIGNYGGSALIRDAGLLESAIEQPRAQFDGKFLHGFPFEMAAAYLFHIVMNHPFVDGNKRTGTVAALVFLDWNGIAVDAAVGELSDMTLAVASGRAPKDDVASFFASHQGKPEN